MIFFKFHWPSYNVKPFLLLVIPLFIHFLPCLLSQVRVVDFRRVRMREREMAKKLFKSKLGKEIQKEAKKARTFVAGSGIMDSRPALSKDQMGWRCS